MEWNSDLMGDDWKMAAGPSTDGGFDRVLTPGTLSYLIMWLCGIFLTAALTLTTINLFAYLLVRCFIHSMNGLPLLQFRINNRNILRHTVEAGSEAPSPIPVEEDAEMCGPVDDVENVDVGEESKEQEEPEWVMETDTDSETELPKRCYQLRSRKICALNPEDSCDEAPCTCEPARRPHSHIRIPPAADDE